MAIVLFLCAWVAVGLLIALLVGAGAHCPPQPDRRQRRRLVLLRGGAS